MALCNHAVTDAACNGATPDNSTRIVLSNLQNTVRATISPADGSHVASDVSITASNGSKHHVQQPAKARSARTIHDFAWLAQQ